MVCCFVCLFVLLFCLTYRCEQQKPLLSQTTKTLTQRHHLGFYKTLKNYNMPSPQHFPKHGLTNVLSTSLTKTFWTTSPMFTWERYQITASSFIQSSCPFYSNSPLTYTFMFVMLCVYPSCVVYMNCLDLHHHIIQHLNLFSKYKNLKTRAVNFWPSLFLLTEFTLAALLINP